MVEGPGFGESRVELQRLIQMRNRVPEMALLDEGHRLAVERLGIGWDDLAARSSALCARSKCIPQQAVIPIRLYISGAPSPYQSALRRPPSRLSEMPVM